jgi:hypothetical protein
MPPVDFYSFAAATIPVLFLTLAFQERAGGGFLSDDAATALGRQRSRGIKLFRAWYTLSVLFFLILGEVAAIVGLAKRFPLSFHVGYIGWFTLIGLIVGFFGVIAPTVITQLDIILPSKDGPQPSLSRTLLLLIITAVVFCLMIALFVSIVQALLN